MSGSIVPGVTMDFACPEDRDMRLIDDEMVEIGLLLPAWQMKALEEEAHVRGVTTGQLVRTLIGSFFETSAVASSRHALWNSEIGSDYWT